MMLPGLRRFSLRCTGGSGPHVGLGRILSRGALASSEALMLGWFRALMPKEERFFDLFTRHARITLAAAQALRPCRQLTVSLGRLVGAPLGSGHRLL